MRYDDEDDPTELLAEVRQASKSLGVMQRTLGLRWSVLMQRIDRLLRKRRARDDDGG